MTPDAFVRAQIRDAYHRNTHPNIAAIAQAAGLPTRAVSDIAAMERPLTPSLPTETPGTDPSPVRSAAAPAGGQAGFHHITAIHDIRHTDGSVLVFIGCVCGRMLRAGVKELPRHWQRHTEGLL